VRFGFWRGTRRALSADMPSSAHRAYSIGEVLGAGGMGTVYRARDRESHRELVVKEVRRDVANTQVMRSRFAAECRAARRLDHPNVLRYVDSGDDFLAMELAAGAPLGYELTTGPIALVRIGTIGDQLLSALAHAHARGVVHGDVKTDNLLLDTSTGEDRITLIDFGAARLLDEPPDPLFSGTPEYLAPEVIRGAPLGPPADVYGAGCVLYELVTGEMPFGSGAAQLILSRQLDEEVVPPSVRCPARWIPAGLEHVILRALEKDPRTRYATATDMRDALRFAMREVAAAEHPVPRPDPRAEIGAALVRGVPAAIAIGYLALARQLIDEHKLAEAVRELDEAVDILTGGAGAGAAAAGAVPLWPLLLALASTLDGLGNRRRARVAARHAHRSAAIAGSSQGVVRAAALVARLGA
jgi:serine/threonine protein kinase